MLVLPLLLLPAPSSGSPAGDTPDGRHYTGTYDMLSAQGTMDIHMVRSGGRVALSASLVSVSGSVGHYYTEVPEGEAMNITIGGKQIKVPFIFNTSGLGYSLFRNGTVAYTSLNDTIYISQDGSVIWGYGSGGELYYLLETSPIGTIELLPEGGVRPDILPALRNGTAPWLRRFVIETELSLTGDVNGVYIAGTRISAGDITGVVSLVDGLYTSMDDRILAFAVIAHSHIVMRPGDENDLDSAIANGEGSQLARCLYLSALLDGEGVGNRILALDGGTFVVDAGGIWIEPSSLIIPYTANGLESGNYTAYEPYMDILPEASAMASGTYLYVYEADKELAASTGLGDYTPYLAGWGACVGFFATTFLSLYFLNRYSRASFLPRRTAALLSVFAACLAIPLALIADARGAYVLLSAVSLLASTLGGAVALLLAYIAFIGSMAGKKGG